MSKPSSNWEQLKKKLPAPTSNTAAKRERRKRFNGITTYAQELRGTCGAHIPPRSPTPEKDRNAEVVFLPPPSDAPLVAELREMVAGNAVLNESKKATGNYLAIDCEMVGLGHLGSESALARVSIVNYHGHIVYDTFVQPREKVTDWRTWVSGVSAADVQGAPPFDEVQKKVAELVEGRVLIGHAIENDTKALLLSHPNPLVRDTQKCKQLRERAKTKRPGLKKLVELELGLRIQAGSHSSITDARATMALYRLHKTEWEASLRKVMEAYREKAGLAPLQKGKRKRSNSQSEASEADAGEGKRGKSEGKGVKKEFPGGGRKGVSSGLSVVVRRFGKKVESDQPRRRGPAPAASSGSGNWWEEGAA